MMHLCITQCTYWTPLNGAPKSCLTTGFVNTCNRNRPITITTGLRFGFKISSHKFLWEHFLKILQNKDQKLKINKKFKCLIHFGAPNLGARGRLPPLPPSYATAYTDSLQHTKVRSFRRPTKTANGIACNAVSSYLNGLIIR